MIKQLYMKLPKKLRLKISIYRYKYKLKLKINEILKYYKRISLDDETSIILNYIKDNNKIPNFPYEWADESKYHKINVFYDNIKSMNYVLLDEKKLYYPSYMSKEEIQKTYHFVQHIEQHNESPHLYLTNKYNIEENDIVVDCGVAEGNFALSIIEKAKHIYLFEADEKWIEALNATFEPWKNKVTIIRKYISNIDNEENIKLDTYFKDKEKPNFVKLDIEGYEEKALIGANEILSLDKNIKIVSCTYHYANDYEKIQNILRNNNFKTEPSKGYMFFWMYDEFKPPYIRRGLIRAYK